MTKFKMGDRVAVYHAGKRYKETVLNIYFNGALDVFGPGQVTVHPKQCRRLKPKKKKEPRRFWLNLHANGYCDIFHSKGIAEQCAAGDKFVEFVEVQEVLK